MGVVCLVCLIATTQAAPWSRGNYGKLSFSEDAKSYIFDYSAQVSWSSSPMSLVNATGSAESSGSDATLGVFDELELQFGSAGSLAVRYYKTIDGFTFMRRPGYQSWRKSPNATSSLPLVWPSFSLVGTPVNETLKTRCLSWAERYFFGGDINPRDKTGHPPIDLRQCGQTGSPMFFFDLNVTTGASPAMVLSPLSHFTCQQVVNCPPVNHKVFPFEECHLGVSPITQSKGGKCERFNTTIALLARPGLTRATRAFGSIIRQVHNTTRKRGPGVTQLSYWSDNQAGYSWWTVGPDQKVGKWKQLSDSFE